MDLRLTSASSSAFSTFRLCGKKGTGTERQRKRVFIIHNIFYFTNLEERIEESILTLKFENFPLSVTAVVLG